MELNVFNAHKYFEVTNFGDLEFARTLKAFNCEKSADSLIKDWQNKQNYFLAEQAAQKETVSVCVCVHNAFLKCVIGQQEYANGTEWGQSGSSVAK